MPRSTESWRIGPEMFARKLDLELDAGSAADGGAARGGSRGEPRRARDGGDRPADVGDDLPRRADPPRRRRGPAHLDPPRPGGGGPRPRHARRRSSPTPARPSATIKEFITAQQDPPPPRARPVPGDRDARVHAGQLGGVSEPVAAARPRGLERVRDQPTAGRLVRRAGRELLPANTTGRCSRS